MGSVSGRADPVVRRITAADIAEALSQGLRDFQAVPLYGLALGALYAAGGNAILLCLTAFGMVYLAYPLAAGFAMIGPFVGSLPQRPRGEHSIPSLQRGPLGAHCAVHLPSTPQKRPAAQFSSVEHGVPHLSL
jgi:hypothetical protein